MKKISARKLQTTLFLNHFPLREISFSQLHLGLFLPPRVWARRRQPTTCKSAEHDGHVTRPGTVVAACLGPPVCLEMIYNQSY